KYGGTEGILFTRPPPNGGVFAKPAHCPINFGRGKKNLSPRGNIQKNRCLPVGDLGGGEECKNNSQNLVYGRGIGGAPKVRHKRKRLCRRNMTIGGVFMKSTVVKRSLVVAGHKTSVSLEDAFWNGLKEIVRERHMTLSELVAEIDAQRHGNLSSALR